MSIEKAIELQKQIAAKERSQVVLLKELEGSLLIKAIWPDAFEYGPCTFGGNSREGRHQLHRHMMMYESWFKNGIGDKRYLTRDELARFKPDILIHKDYKVPE